jgi:hypothetical protein
MYRAFLQTPPVLRLETIQLDDRKTGAQIIRTVRRSP